MKLPPLPPLRHIVPIYGLQAKSQLSQNFIFDLSVTDRIVEKLGDDLDKALVIEVGPGPGSLSRSILNAGATNLVSVEKDPRFQPLLNQLADASKNRFHFLIDDMRTVEYDKILAAAGTSLSEAIKTKTYIVGNLPFAVATPMLVNWLRLCSHRVGLFQNPNNVEFLLMFQKEVGERITARPGTRSRSRISVLSQSVCDVKLTQDIPRGVFVPKPKVNAAVVRLRPSSSPVLQGCDIEALEAVLRWSFASKRKTIKNSIRSSIPEGTRILGLAGIDPDVRAETLSTEEFVRLAQICCQEGLIPVRDPEHGRP
ncbi:mitochondrial transcription factor B-like protein [Polychytrium aggregatum]|uniref:mitochondrial transcription factor B-like protein n=1 Tax=Polychytrium aggregatum TaxID=110093 RepID=UPI0022FE9F10|nr:mitochondrial transcription factor B-like protein [Polychytrium aggregatum]KAI9208903.1 mitochondrial transcription factor B-like protein [Polychytrium aggregatum]